MVGFFLTILFLISYFCHVSGGCISLSCVHSEKFDIFFVLKILKFFPDHVGRAGGGSAAVGRGANEGELLLHGQRHHGGEQHPHWHSGDIQINYADGLPGEARQAPGKILKNKTFWIERERVLPSPTFHIEFQTKRHRSSWIEIVAPCRSIFIKKAIC